MPITLLMVSHELAGLDAGNAVHSVLPDVISNLTSLRTEEDTTVELFEGGCTAGTTRFNCKQVCHSRSSLFANPLTVYNCLVSSTLSPNTARVSNFFDAEKWVGFKDPHSFDGPGVIGKTEKCYSATCHSGAYDFCESLHPDSLEKRGGISYKTRLKSIGAALKSMVPVDTDHDVNTPDADIVGPGLYISYLTQMVVATFFWIVTATLSWMQGLIGLREWLLKFQQKLGTPNAAGELDPIRWKNALRSICSSRPVTAISTCMADFQETQVFFVLSIQMTAFIVFSRAFLEGQIGSIRYAGFFASVNHMPVLMVQISLQRANMRWFYTFFLSVIVYTLGMVSSHTLAVKGNQVNLRACGGNPGVTGTSVPSPTGYPGKKTVPLAGYLSTITMVILFLDNMKGRSEVLQYWPPKCLPRSRQLFCDYFRKLQWFCLDILMAFFLIDLFVDMQYAVSTAASSGWSYGQVAAVLPWLPIGSRLIYYLLFGVKDGVGNRIDRHFVVSERPHHLSDLHTNF